MFPEPIIIEPTVKTPEVILDKENNTFQIRGRSISENSHEFFLPIKNWLTAYFKHPNNLTKLILNFDYLNSSSAIQISNIINLFEKNYKKNIDVLLVWQYERGDELIENTGIELNIISDVPFVTEIFETEEFEKFDFDFDD